MATKVRYRKRGVWEPPPNRLYGDVQARAVRDVRETLRKEKQAKEAAPEGADDEGEEVRG